MWQKQQEKNDVINYLTQPSNKFSSSRDNIWYIVTINHKGSMEDYIDIVLKNEVAPSEQKACSACG